MSGHNKWSKIKNKKGAEDARRGKVFTKLGRMIAVAAREGGGDPEYNASLKAAVDKAKAENMPNDNIDRAIKKGLGDTGQDNYEEIMYEGYGPGGIAVLVSCLTDNRNRTAADVRHAFEKNGGNLGQNGSVSFLFSRRGVLAIESKDQDETDVMMKALEAGAEDMITEDGVFVIYTSPEDFNSVKDQLLDEGFNFVTAEISYLPANYTDLTDKDQIKNMSKMIDLLEDLDDVQEIYHNWSEEE